MRRRFALLKPSNVPPMLKYYVALPPGTEIEGAEELPAAHFVILEEDEDGASLTRYSRQGAFAGDTWHSSVDDALRQLDYEYGGRLGEWRDFPSDTRDLVGFAVSSVNPN